jgi:outer membrane scaffolding protein for murein synthesis (MipA/OmpV family)
MKQVIRLTRILFGVVLLLASAGVVTAAAQSYTAGGGLAMVPDYMGSDDYEVVPLPYFTVDFGNHMDIRLVGNRLSSNLIPHPVFKAGLVGEYIGERDDVEDNRVDRMNDVDDSIMLGGFVGFAQGGWSGRIEVLTDVADGNDGTIGRLAVGWGTALNETMRLNIEGSTTYGDDDFMDAYFSVDAADSARSGLARYNADGGIYSVGLSATHNWRFADDWRLVSLLGLSRLVGDADDSSPVVDRGSENQGRLGIMVTYTF